MPPVFGAHRGEGHGGGVEASAVLVELVLADVVKTFSVRVMRDEYGEDDGQRRVRLFGIVVQVLQELEHHPGGDGDDGQEQLSAGETDERVELVLVVETHEVRVRDGARDEAER